MSSAQQTIIDDADASTSGFQYFGSWGLGQPLSQHLEGTAHYSDLPLSSAILFFRGHSVAYYADRNSNLSLAAVSIDGLPEENVNLTSTTTAYQQPVWSKNFAEGDHQLVIRHAGPSSPKTNIMIDYVTITHNGDSDSTSAGPAASKVPSSALTINATDPRINFSPNWRAVSGILDGTFYSGQSWLTQTSGASVQFEFNGTAIWYFTDTNYDHGVVRIRVDNDHDGERVDGYSPTSLSQRLVWSRMDLPPGTHTINITHEDSNGKYATLDFFRYIESAGSEPIASKHGLKAGAIVGIVVASLFLLGIIYCILIRWATPRYWSDDADDNTAPPSYHAAIRPSRSRSGSTTPSNPFFIASVPPARTDEMTNRMSNPVTITSDTNQPGDESSQDTPAQRYRDSARALLVGNRTSRSSGIGTSPIMTQRSASTPDLHSGLSINITTPQPLIRPPPYQS